MTMGGKASQATATRREDRIIADRYRLVRELGRGGMGRVYEAIDLGAGDARVALKQLGRASAVGRIRFRREFHTLARARHPNIVEVFEFGEDAAGPYYTMELLDGADLRQLGPMPWREACRPLCDVTAALAFLHVRGLVHRDVSPRNVRSTADGRAKLIDFGVLSTVGTVDDLCGTPPVVAPENARGVPIDHRADLFGLGALAYWLISGEHAYPAPDLQSLELVWRRPPRPLSELRDVPPALSELVMALLDQSPDGRPPSSEVIDRLATLADLDPSSEAAARGYLQSATMVGRERELGKLERAVRRARRGHGSAFVIEGPSGMGKSRLLREVGLHGQVAGALVLRATGELADHGPFALLRRLAAQLFERAHAVAAGAAGNDAAIIDRLVGGTAGSRRLKSGVHARDPAEQRMAVQAALGGWLARVARQSPLVLLIDDVQRADEASLATLTSLCHQAAELPIALVATLRTGEEPRAKEAVASLCDAATRARLGGLDAADVGAICETVFGRVPNVQRIASAVGAVAGGSPLHVIETLRALVDAGAARYVEGEWVLPPGLPEDVAHARLDEAVERRIDALDRGARALAEVLALFGRRFTLEECAAVANQEEQELLEALSELTERELLTGGPHLFRFRHDSVREALLRGIDAERTRELHLRIGRYHLARGPVAPEDEVRVGWHLLHGGERPAGAELLDRGGRRLFHAQSFAESRAPLEAALEAYREHPRLARNCPELMQMLLLGGCMCDRRQALEYLGPTLEAARRLSGVTVARHLARFTGVLVALAVGLAIAYVRWLCRRAPRGPTPRWALEQLFVCSGFGASVRSLCWELAELDAMVAEIDALGSFGERPPEAVRLLIHNLAAFPRGRLAEVRANTERIVHILDAGSWLTPAHELDVRLGKAGAILMRALTRVSEQDARYEEDLRALAQLDLRFFELGALQARIAFHRCRGEEALAVGYEREAEVLLVRLGSAWQMEAWLAVVSSLAYGFSRDAIGLKRTIRRLARLTEEGCGFAPALELARGEYRRERGDIAQAVVHLRRALELAGEELLLVRLPALPALAEALLAAGELAEARQLAEQGVREASDPESGQIINRLRSLRALALITAETDLEAAVALVDEAIVEARPIGSPSVSGMLHEARLALALRAGDALTAREQTEALERTYQPTRNQVLVARAAEAGRVLGIGSRRGSARGAELTAPTMPSGSAPEAYTDPWADTVDGSES